MCFGENFRHLMDVGYSVVVRGVLANLIANSLLTALFKKKKKVRTKTCCTLASPKESLNRLQDLGAVFECSRQSC